MAKKDINRVKNNDAAVDDTVVSPLSKATGDGAPSPAALQSLVPFV